MVKQRYVVLGNEVSGIHSKSITFINPLTRVPLFLDSGHNFVVDVPIPDYKLPFFTRLSDLGITVRTFETETERDAFLSSLNQ